MDDQGADSEGGGITKVVRSKSYQLGCLLSIVGGLGLGAATLYECAHMYDVRPTEEDNFPWVFYGSAGVTLIGLICVLFRRLIDKII
jgi:hypothetical protein